MHEGVTRLPLNQGQQAAAEGFLAFLFSDNKELCISGPGGVGKTFLMGHLIDEIMPMYFAACQERGHSPEYYNVVMTATTNKAADVLAADTGRPTSTIHSFLGLKVKENFSTGESHVSKSGMWQVHSNIILFVDESSMIDTPLLKLIREGTINSKIVYVGDHKQLAPVKEKLSPVYREDLPFFELTQPMRTDVPELQALNQQFRDTVETLEFNDIKLVPGIIDFCTDEQMLEELDAHFIEQTAESKVLAYTNRRVMDLNAHIRDLRELPNDYQVGEYLVNNSAIRLKQGMLSVEEQILITDIDQRIVDVRIDKTTDLKVRYAIIENSFGDLWDRVPLPVDRDHFNRLVKYYASAKNWERYFFLKNSFPDLRQRDASTVYKAQGSSYTTVFIDLGDISDCHNPAQVARMLYVAFSRARKRVVLYGELAPKYGQLIQ